MKEILKEYQNTDNIEKIKFEEFKKQLEGDSMLGRIKYRKAVGNMMTGKRPVVAKGEILRKEHLHADGFDEKEKNPNFGFKCLHYSVSEASGSIRILIDNKKRTAGTVRVCTIDAEAKAGDDYEEVKQNLEFKNGQAEGFIEVKIRDDDNWEPDEDFYVQLYDPNTLQELEGRDTKTKVTIIDDDKPGQICFEESKAIKAIASEKVAEIVISRKNGSDGEVKVDYETIQLDTSSHTATPGLDYVHVKDTLVFIQGETSKIITIEILERKDEEVRDESFGIQLSNIRPAGAKLSKKSFQIVNIVTDAESKKKQEALAQLLRKIEDEEETTWYSQFVSACMLHPTKNEDGDITDITAMDGTLHFICIGWKLFFAFIPPPHIANGWACFAGSLCFIGIVTAVVGEFANLFGCVLGVEPAITAITFVALGTSLPDTFASMAAATAEKYADSAVGNVTGSNSVNVFLGLGLPWVIAVIWSASYKDAETGESYPGYYVPAGSLGFSVVVFIFIAIICIIVLLARRYYVGGELGGTQMGRTLTAGFFTGLWLLYVVISTL
jgi:solute carrier family 8 (sodium/calcium exchanger)